MEPIISKKEINELMKIKGKIRGVALKAALEFILKEEGKEGLKKLEDTIANLGYPIKHNKISVMGFYPLETETVIFVAIEKLFNYDDKKFQEMGEFQFKMPIIIRLFMRYLSSVDTVARAAPKMWETYFTIGTLKISKYDINERYMIVEVKDFHFHAAYIYCQIFKGYFPSVVEMVVKTDVSCEETKCSFRNDKYHEFLLKW